MKKMIGVSVSSGLAFGHLTQLRRRVENDRKIEAGMETAEVERFESAVRSAAAYYRTFSEEQFSKYSIDLMEAHAMLAEDPGMRENVRKFITEEHLSAETAIHRVACYYEQKFSNMTDALIRARAADIRDVGQCLIDCLRGEEGLSVRRVLNKVILAADDLLPSELLRFDRRKLAGIVLEEGSEYSHTAILARSMLIPMIIGVRDIMEAVEEDVEVMIDGDQGCVYIEPDEDMQLFWLQKSRRERKLSDEAVKNTLPSELGIKVSCSIGTVEEIALVKAAGVREIGLFRSEFLYLAAGSEMSEDGQFEAYKYVIEALNGGRVVIRTFDFGLDKGMLPGARKELRGIRFAQAHPDVFRTQLRAILRAAYFGNAAIMFPMISAVWEVRDLKRICGEVMSELEAEGEAYPASPRIGIIVETPAAVMQADRLAAEVDFFSVGTNDLMRSYELLGAEDVIKETLNAIERITKAAHRAEIPVSICGEIGADPAYAETFIKMGVDELVVRPSAVEMIRQIKTQAH